MGKEQELLDAARNGNLAVVERILSQRAKKTGPLASLRRGPGTNAHDQSGYTSLHHSALNGHREIVALLLDHEASANVVDGQGSTPLHLAAWTGNTDVVRLLLERGPSLANVNHSNQEQETALHFAAQYGHADVVALLLSHGAEPGLRNMRGESPLDLAAQYGRLESVSLLAGAQVHSLQRLATPHHSPLHLAARNGHRQVVRLLLDRGFPVNCRTDGGTALHEAATFGKLDVVRLLLDYGVDPDLRDAQGRRATDVLEELNTGIAKQARDMIRERAEADSGGSADASPRSISPPPAFASPASRQGLPRRNSAGLGSPDLLADMAVTRHAKRPSLGRDVARVSLRAHEERPGGPLVLSLSPGELAQVPPPACFQVSGRGDGNAACEDGQWGSGYLPMSALQQPKPQVCLPCAPPAKPPRRSVAHSPGGVYEQLCLASSGRRRRLSSGDSRSPPAAAAEYVDMRPAPSNENHDASSRLCELSTLYDQVNKRAHPVPNLKKKKKKSEPKPNSPEEAQVRASARLGEDVFYFIYNECLSGRQHTRSASDTTGGGCSSDERPGSLALCSRVGSGKRATVQIPLSPSHYEQPPTPEFPPPSPTTAESGILDRIRPLSRDGSRRSSRDADTLTDEDELLEGGAFEKGERSPPADADDDNNHGKKASRSGPGKPEKLVSTLVVPSPPAAARQPSRNVVDVVVFAVMKPATQPQAVDANSHGDGETDVEPSRQQPSSPFDENAEWAEIADIMASFGSGIARESVFARDMEEEFARTLTRQKKQTAPIKDGLSSARPETIDQWLLELGLPEYANLLLVNGYDDVRFLFPCGRRRRRRDQRRCRGRRHLQRYFFGARLGCPLWGPSFPRNNGPPSPNAFPLMFPACELRCKTSPYFRNKLLSSLASVQFVVVSFDEKRNANGAYQKQLPKKEAASQTVQDSGNLGSTEIKLLIKFPSLETGSFLVRESFSWGFSVFTSFAENPSGVTFWGLSVDIPKTRNPSYEFAVLAMPFSQSSDPSLQYLGSTLVKELQGTESTRQSIHKLKASTRNIGKIPSVLLSVSHRGVKFVDAVTKRPVCEHEIRNIHCACQDADDLTHFAYITKEHQTNHHYCHVFCAQTMELATEIILTLGQAFEVAYQLVLRDQRGAQETPRAPPASSQRT
ncbi:unnamed protein product [Ixodes hexagonus]